MANNLATILFLSIMLLFAAANPLAFGESFGCPGDVTIYGNYLGQGGAAVATFYCTTRCASIQTVGQSAAIKNGSFIITASNAQIPDGVNLNDQPTPIPCVVGVRPSPTAGYLFSALRCYDHEACGGETRVTRCDADNFNLILPCGGM